MRCSAPIVLSSTIKVLRSLMPFNAAAHRPPTIQVPTRLSIREERRGWCAVPPKSTACASRKAEEVRDRDVPAPPNASSAQLDPPIASASRRRSFLANHRNQNRSKQQSSPAVARSPHSYCEGSPRLRGRREERGAKLQSCIYLSQRLGRARGSMSGFPEFAASPCIVARERDGTRMPANQPRPALRRA